MRAVVIGILLTAWAVVVIGFHASMGGTRTGINLQELGPALLKGVADACIGTSISLLVIPGVVHLVRQGDDGADFEMRLLGWMIPCGFLGSAVAFHILQDQPESFHVMLFVQTIFVMPVGVIGLARLCEVGSHALRISSLTLLAAVIAMGLHTLIMPRFRNPLAEWHVRDLETIKQVLRGQPFGYFANNDRGWWISKNAVLASMLDSRCVRLNPLQSEARSVSSKFYDYTKPFALVPPQPDERAGEWSLRFAKKLGLRYLIETPHDRLPKLVLDRSRLLAGNSYLRVYKLDAVSHSVAAKQSTCDIDHCGNEPENPITSTACKR